jgi:hypothetical protein
LRAEIKKGQKERGNGEKIIKAGEFLLAGFVVGSTHITPQHVESGDGNAKSGEIIIHGAAFAVFCKEVTFGR